MPCSRFQASVPLILTHGKWLISAEWDSRYDQEHSHAIPSKQAIYSLVIYETSQWPGISGVKWLVSLTTSRPLHALQRPPCFKLPDDLELFWHETEPTTLFFLRNTIEVCFLETGSVNGHKYNVRDWAAALPPSIHTTVLRWYLHREGHCPGPAPGSAAPGFQHKHKNSSWL